MNTVVPSELQFVNEDGVYMTLCLDLVAYWRGSLFDRAEGIRNFYEQTRAVIGDRWRRYTTETMKRPKAADAQALEMVPFWLTPKSRRRDIYIMALEGSTKAFQPSDAAFYLLCNEEKSRKGGLIRAILPPDHFGRDFRRLYEFARDLLGPLDFDFATAGYSVNWDPNGNSSFDALERFPWVARRFPGVDLVDYDATLYSLIDADDTGLKCINWLTALGPALSARVPEPAVLNMRWGSAAFADRLDADRKIFVAGAAPSVADRNRGEELPAYALVGSALEGVRMRDHAEFIGANPDMPDIDMTSDWLARFDHSRSEEGDG